MTNIIGLGVDLSGKVINSRSVITEELGIQRLTEVSTCTTFSAGISSNALAGENLPSIYSIHPEFPNMSCESVNVSNLPGGLAQITAQYAGFMAESVTFNWPPVSSPNIASITQASSTVPNVSAVVRYFPNGERASIFSQGGDWLEYPLIVEIRFIDSTENETKLYSDYRIGETELPLEFRGITILAPETAPYFDEPEIPNPPPSGTTFFGVKYDGVILSGLSIVRRGNLFNEIRATFKDKFSFPTFSVQ